MTPLRLVLSAGLTLALACPTTGPLAAPAAKPAKASPPAASANTASEIEPAAVQALTRMSAYLGALTAFEIKSETSMDLVMDDGQALKLDGVNHYIVHRPDGFVVEIATAKKVRRLIYDGKSLTLVAPVLGYYATVDAPPTIRQTLDVLNDRYGITLPLQDLFRWSDPNQGRSEALKAAMVVGPANLNGVDCDQYAFREGDIDWQIWIQRGDKPLPLKVVIIDRRELAHPQFEARLDWNLSPQLASGAFTFHPDKGAMPIRLASLRQ